MSFSSPLHLAALAVSAVSGLTPTSAKPFTRGGDAQFIAGVITSDQGDLIIRIPRDTTAEVLQSAEILGQTALTGGVRKTLSFQVPEVLGIASAGETRAVVSTFISGFPLPVEQLTPGMEILTSIAHALRQLHGLPTQIVQQAGLPVLSAEAVRLEISRLIERAGATRLVPAILLEQWLKVIHDSDIWDFAPVVVHGDVHAGRILVENDQVSGILGFDKLSVGDPASDLAWLLEAGTDVFITVLAEYGMTTLSAEKLRKRAQLLHELQVAKWLLYGQDTHNQEIINDAIILMDGLVDTALVQKTSDVRTLDEDEVHEALDTMPEISRIRSDTEAFEGLDDERIFVVDNDFADNSNASADADTSNASTSPDHA